jgi:hypothetical protein
MSEQQSAPLYCCQDLIAAALSDIPMLQLRPQAAVQAEGRHMQTAAPSYMLYCNTAVT